MVRPSGSDDQIVNSADAVASSPELALAAAERFDALYSRVTTNPTYKRVYREVYGDEYPADAEQFGTATRTDLRRIAEMLGVEPGQVFLDVGCGAGGPG